MKKKEVIDEQGALLEESSELEEQALTAQIQQLAHGKRLGAAVISQQQLENLWSTTPKHAIRVRPGPKGKALRYVTHGYVEFILNRAFGGDWDLEPLPVFAGNVFHLQIAETKVQNKTVISYSVTVMAKLTVRVRDPKSLEVITTIVKQEFGSSVWYPENEFGDALKSALSDALKRCGLRLGIALDLYYDDDRARESQEENDKLAKLHEEELLAAKREKLPETSTEVIIKAKEVYGIAAPELLRRLYELDFAAGMARLAEQLVQLGAAEVWKQVQSLYSDSTE